MTTSFSSTATKLQGCPEVLRLNSFRLLIGLIYLYLLLGLCHLPSCLHVFSLVTVDSVIMSVDMEFLIDIGGVFVDVFVLLALEF